MRISLLRLAMLLTIANLFLCSCSESEMTEPEEEIRFIAPTIQANFDLIKNPRTHLDENTGVLKWTPDDELLIFVHEVDKQPSNEEGWLKCRYKFVTDESNCINNKFYEDKTSDHPLRLNPSKEYNWYVMSPYNESVKSPVGHGSFIIGDQILDFSKTTAHLSAKDLMTSVDYQVKAKEEVKISLKHLATLMMFRIYNKQTSDFIPSYIEFETKGKTNIPIGGTCTVDFEKGITPISGSNKMLLNLTNAPSIKPKEYFDVYTMMIPFKLEVNEQFNIHLVTNNSNSLQTSTMRAPIFFQKGTINRANVYVTPFPISTNINPWGVQGEIDGEIQI